MLCLLSGHRPDRRGARHDGAHFWTRCQRCAQPMLRGIDGWRKPSPDEMVKHKINIAGRMQLYRTEGLRGLPRPGRGLAPPVAETVDVEQVSPA